MSKFGFMPHEIIDGMNSGGGGRILTEPYEVQGADGTIYVSRQDYWKLAFDPNYQLNCECFTFPCDCTGDAPEPHVVDNKIDIITGTPIPTTTVATTNTGTSTDTSSVTPTIDIIELAKANPMVTVGAIALLAFLILKD